MTIEKVTSEQLNKIRLLLSTYQDGTGRDMKDSNYVNWEDFEDITEVVFKGKRLKSKSVFDVIVNDIGISCKITQTLQQTQKNNIVLIEHSRINAEFFDFIKKQSLTRDKIFENPQLCGNTLIDLINIKHDLDANKNKIDLQKSFFLVMTYDRSLKQFKIFQFPIKMPNKEKVKWNFNNTNKHLKGIIGNQLVAQWFPDSGGQFKYYPVVTKAIWQSDIFFMEPLNCENKISIEDKAKKYFPNSWKEINS